METAVQLKILATVFSTILGTTVIFGSLSGCAKPTVPNVNPFQHLSQRQYSDIAENLRAQGVLVYKQEGSVQIVITARKIFYKNTLQINPRQTQILNNIATLVRHAPTAQIQVIGYSNSVPNYAEQKIQSGKMAQAIAKQLQLRGMPISQNLTVTGRGNQPISGSLTAKGNAQNERVEILIN
jgi:outer membrane protein OmpA-like peptidoglycan-associated protein